MKYGVPILVIAFGVAWLLNVNNILPGVNWIWTAGLAVSGILLLVLDKLNKFNFVVGLFLIVAALFSILRQTGKITSAVEVPTLFILLGVLMLLAQVFKLQKPSWIMDDKKRDEEE